MRREQVSKIRGLESFSLGLLLTLASCDPRTKVGCNKTVIQLEPTQWPKVAECRVEKKNARVKGCKAKGLPSWANHSADQMTEVVRY